MIENEDKMIYIENEGALFKGFTVPFPKLVWSFKDKKWSPYEGEVPKRYMWGEEISKAEAEEWMAQGD